MRGRLKAVVKHECGEVNLDMKGHPDFEVEDALPESVMTVLFGKLDRYSDNYIFGNEALQYLKWSPEEAARRVKAFHY